MEPRVLVAAALVCAMSLTPGAQSTAPFNDSIRVRKGVDTLLYPWAGGFNYAQFSSFDFDFDPLDSILGQLSLQAAYLFGQSQERA